MVIHIHYPSTEEMEEATGSFLSQSLHHREFETSLSYIWPLLKNTAKQQQQQKRNLMNLMKQIKLKAILRHFRAPIFELHILITCFIQVCNKSSRFLTTLRDSLVSSEIKYVICLKGFHLSRVPPWAVTGNKIDWIWDTIHYEVLLSY